MVCHPDDTAAADQLVADLGFHVYETRPDPGLPRSAGVLWIGDRPEAMSIPRHALRPT